MKDEEFDEFLNSPELQDVLTDLDIEPEEVTRDNFLKKLDEKRPRKEYGFKKIEATRPAVEEEDVPFSVEWGAFVDGRRFTIEGNIHATDEMEACDYVLRGFFNFHGVKWSYTTPPHGTRRGLFSCPVPVLRKRKL